MFENVERNKRMVLGAYKKLKAYYYYDKTILHNKMRLSAWESDAESFDKKVQRLAQFMQTLEKDPDYEYANLLLNSIGFVPLPKAFEEDRLEDEGLITNATSKKSSLCKINFYIKAPVEILILDTIWAVIVGKIAYQQSAISNFSYANKIRARQLYSNDDSLYEGIDFDSNRLFVPYFKRYKKWRNEALEEIKQQYKNNRDTILISLDFKSYYYSAIFNFENLPDYLNDDERLKELKPLTDFVEKVYQQYTNILRALRFDISENCGIDENVLPIGLLSSMLVAEFYLKEFDDNLYSRVLPKFYGRYVDDILLVIPKPVNCEINVEDILTRALVNKGILKKGKGIYTVIVPNNPKHPLALQRGKIRCIYFDHKEPDVLIDLIWKECNIKASMHDATSEFDLEFSDQTFNEKAYSLEANASPFKVRNFLFSPNDYEASLFISSLIKGSKNTDEKDKKDIEEQLNQMLKFYDARHTLEYRKIWSNLFFLALINGQYRFFNMFFARTLGAIKRITADNVEDLRQEESKRIEESIKEVLIEQLIISASIAIAPFNIDYIRQEISSTMVDATGEIKEMLPDMIANAQDIRNANMFNLHFCALPLLNYIIDDENKNFSLISPKSDEVMEVLQKQKNRPLYDFRKVKLSPCFIHFDELCIFYSIKEFPHGGNLISGKIEAWAQEFAQINNLNELLPKLESVSPVDHSCVELHKVRTPFDIGKESVTEVKIALANIAIDEERDIIPSIKKPLHGLTSKRKYELHKLLKEASDKGANIVVFPEYFLPIHWLEEVCTFARKNSVAVICGLRYLVKGKRAYNFILVIQPFSYLGYKYAIPLLREKNNYAPEEIVKLASQGLDCIDPTKKSIHTIDWNGVKISDLMCFELTNIEYRYLLRGNADILIIPELNKDTAYFSNIVESAARDLHCFVVQANTAKYGDSRITGPYKSQFKDIVKVKGGENNVFLIGTANCSEVKEKRKNYLNEIEKEKQEQRRCKGRKSAPKIDKVKGLPAGFFHDGSIEKNEK